MTVFALRQGEVEFSRGDILRLILNLDIKPQDRVAVMGRSGVGKTTLLRILAGLQAFEGEGTWHYAKKIGIVFQEPALLPWRTVRRNILFPAELKGIEPSDYQTCDNLIEHFGLSERRNHRPYELSGG